MSEPSKKTMHSKKLHRGKCPFTDLYKHFETNEEAHFTCEETLLCSRFCIFHDPEYWQKEPELLVDRIRQKYLSRFSVATHHHCNVLDIIYHLFHLIKLPFQEMSILLIPSFMVKLVLMRVLLPELIFQGLVLKTNYLSIIQHLKKKHYSLVSLLKMKCASIISRSVMKPILFNLFLLSLLNLIK